jgi:hypothetical protein
MGAFTNKWRQAVAIAIRTLAGTLYARYYDLPEAQASAQPPAGPASGGRFDVSGRVQAPDRGRRFLGWSVGPHWTLATTAER